MLFLALLGALLWVPKAGCEEKPPARKIDTLMSMDELDNSQKLKPAYVISIRILEDKRDALQQRVSLTGEIQAPYIGLIKAEGLTCQELAFKIKRELKKLEKGYLVNFTINPPVEENFFADATVLVTLDPAMPHEDCIVEFVVAFGSIAKQGKYDFEGIPDHKLSALIKRAGGFTSKSTIPKIRVIRKTPEGNKTIVVDGKALLNKKREADLVLQASDVMIVE